MNTLLPALVRPSLSSVFSLVLLSTLLGTAAHAQTSVADLSLEELMTINVQTASRKSQRLQDVPAAVFVITRDDITRAGVTSIPEALRLAPGMQVARMASSRWAVSARGFNGRFANKLLVLMDGRSVYSPLFAGVLWEKEDTLLEDVDRIEVIRGPGAALWGANAVNGVINIITRKASDTRDNLAVLNVGSEDRSLLALRRGMAAGDGALRLWAKAFKRDTSVDAQGQPGNDNWRGQRAGFRGDWAGSDGKQFMLSGSAYDTPSTDTLFVANVAAPRGFVVTPLRQDNSGAHLLARHTWTGATESALQVYVDSSNVTMEGVTREQRQTLDVDFQQRTQAWGQHDIVWGGGWRMSRDRIDSNNGKPGIVNIQPPQRTWQLFSVFAQDDITLQPDTLRAVLGARLEHNSYTGVETQPNARLIWTPSATQSVWAAWSRAVRTPSRAERGSVVDLSVVPGDYSSNPPRPAVLIRSDSSSEAFDSEKVSAFELGLRQQLHNQFSLDLAAYSNRYTDLRGGRTGPVAFQMSPVPHAVQTIYGGNTVHARTQGLELALDWQPNPAWRVQSAYTTTRIKASAEMPQDSAAQGTAQAYNVSAPRHQTSVRVAWAMSNQLNLDLWLRRTPALPGSTTPQAAIPAYTGLDLRLAWRPISGLELALGGQNLLERRHAEFTPDLLPSQDLQVQRAVYGTLKWQF
jgi:iron complex outermembrane recepter protein